jgi:hypothetical protein
MLRRVDTGLWVAEAPLRFVGLEIGARMTVARLPDGRLWLHSPIAASEDLVRAVRAEGAIACIVAPNRLHHLFVSDWRSLAPEARSFIAPGLAAKRPDLARATPLADAPDPEWAEVFDQVLVDGMPYVNEVVFFHRATKTLVVADLAFNFGAESSPLTRFTFRMLGGYGRLGPTALERGLVRDRAAFRRSLERILEWPFGRVIVAHGAVCEAGGRAQLERGYAWALR